MTAQPQEERKRVHERADHSGVILWIRTDVSLVNCFGNLSHTHVYIETHAAAVFLNRRTITFRSVLFLIPYISFYSAQTWPQLKRAVALFGLHLSTLTERKQSQCLRGSIHECLFNTRFYMRMCLWVYVQSAFVREIKPNAIIYLNRMCYDWVTAPTALTPKRLCACKRRCARMGAGQVLRGRSAFALRAQQPANTRQINQKSSS